MWAWAGSASEPPPTAARSGPGRLRPGPDRQPVRHPLPAEAARRWAEYASHWTGWNTLRAVASLVSLLLVGAGLLAWTLPDGQP
ncbi:hypothetical protein ACIBF5_16705 [Micromonospora sp. NPDC050417]|uniref:hypothetical protein n=1 Tax=Micromonospora sp. NPDC050417 TaxID=3364280 RepID=UPI0037AA4B62